jgi:hypothetical protein
MVKVAVAFADAAQVAQRCYWFSLMQLELLNAPFGLRIIYIMQLNPGPRSVANRSSLKAAQCILNAAVVFADAAQAWAYKSGQW